MSAPDRSQASDERAGDLAGSVRLLAERIEALQADVRRLGGPALPADTIGWDEEAESPPPSSYAWIGALEPRLRRRPAAPRLLLEAIFLVAVAVAAGLADLDAAVIAAVMAGAWVLVALIEVTASRADRRRDELVAVRPPDPISPAPADRSWFVPPVEQTLLETPSDSVTVVTKLPPAAPAPDVTAERPPAS